MRALPSFDQRTERGSDLPLVPRDSVAELEIDPRSPESPAGPPKGVSQRGVSPLSNLVIEIVAS